MAQHTDHSEEVQVVPANKEKIAKIWKVAGLLAVVTAIEFAIAFAPFIGREVKVAVFIGLTIVKAFYIVAEFMHLGHEVKSLIWSILIPFIFIVWFIIAMLYQGDNLYMWG